MHDVASRFDGSRKQPGRDRVAAYFLHPLSCKPAGGQRWDLAWICSLNYLYPKPFHRPLCFNLDLVLIGLDNPQAEAVRALCTCQTLVANASGLPSHLQALLTCTSIIPPDTDALVAFALSLSLPTMSTSNLQAIFEGVFYAALKEYEKKTKKDLITHPLATQLQHCDSPSSILAFLDAQIQNFKESTNGNERWFSVIIVLDHPCLGCSDMELTQAMTSVNASQRLMEIFDGIENFLRRLDSYIAAPPMTDAVQVIMVKILIEVIGNLGFVAKEVQQSRSSKLITDDTFPVADKDLEKFLRKLIGRTDIEDALRRWDRLMEEEARVLAAQAYVTRNVGTRVETVSNQVTRANDLVHEGAFSTLATHTCHRKPLYD